MKNINKKNNQPIGVFDSGVGGLSILAELKRLLPHENFVFLADQLYVPYGEKSKKELVTLTSKITDFFIKKHNIKMMVVACNTATCGAIDELRAKYSFPIIGTVPAVRPAAKGTTSGTIGVISTPSTSQSEVMKSLIKENCAGIEVLNIGCKNLENEVEKGELSSPEVGNLLDKYLKEIKASPADYLVLGCTHYPFLKKAIKKIVGSKVKLIDSGKAIAKRTKVLLGANSMENKQKRVGNTLYFSTGDALKFAKVASKLLGKKIKAAKVRI